MLEQTIKNLIQHMSFIQQYMKTYQESGFNDITRLMESMSIKLFNATHNLNLINMNQIKVNFPAIDLADDSKKIAIQVTSNANKTKINKTIKQYEKNGFDKKYKELFIFGFLEYSKSKEIPKYCTVLGVDSLIEILTDNHNEEIIQEVIDTLKQHTDFSMLHPYDDFDCLEIVLRCIDRNAIKHKISCEGSYEDMSKGLNEITELISKGSINKKHKSKSLDEFNDAVIQKFLQSVRDKIGKIIAIVNKSRQPNTNFVYIKEEDFYTIDKLKLEIIKLSNKISTKYKSDIHIESI